MTARLTVADLAEGGCREVTVWQGGERIEGFAMRHQGRLHLYRNRCPHTGAPLNWRPDTFLTPEGDLIQCALHGALFRIEDGLCLHGPCQGRHLAKLELPEEGA